MSGKGWYSYHLLKVFNPYFLLVSQLTRRATLFCLFWCSFWASLEDSLVIYMIVSVFVPQSLHNEVSGVLFVLNLMEYVLNARSWAASITHTIFFLRSSFLATFTSVPISYVGLLNSPSKSFSCNYFSFLGKLFSCIDLCFTSPIKLLPLSLKYVWVFLFVFVFLLGCLFGDILLMS